MTALFEISVPRMFSFTPVFIPHTNRRNAIRRSCASHPALIPTRVGEMRPRSRLQSGARMAAELSLSATVRTGDALDETLLSEFSESIKGEWTGYEGNFSSDTGEAQAIPDVYVPEDFLSWGLHPYGFESVHSTIVRSKKFYRKFFRVLPTVALFADHVDLETDILIDDFSTQPAFHIFADGSHSAGAHPVNTVRSSILDSYPSCDFCLRHRDEHRGARKALHIRLNFDFESASFVEELRIVHEEFTCIYCDGADIEGSSGYVEGWVLGERCHPQDLKGEWQVGSTGNGDLRVVKRMEGGPAEESNRQLYLPEGIDVGIERTEDGGRHVHVGWLCEKNLRIVITRAFAKDGNVLWSSRTEERRVGS